MTTLKELNELARECEACAMGDHRSLNTHLKECNTCSEYYDRAESFNDHLKDIRMISGKDDTAMHRDLYEQITKIANMEDGERHKQLSGMYDAISILPEGERIKLVKTRTDILTDFPKYERDPIMASLRIIVKDWDSDRKKTEMRSTIKATDDYPVLKKMMVRNMFEKIMG